MMSTLIDEPVLIERRDSGVLLIAINRPDQRNAVNGAVAEGIGQALEALDADADLRIGILTGVGKGFCAGADLKAFAAGERGYYADRGFAGITQRSADKPLIAAVEGFALAGGLEVAIACDLLVASRGARLGIPEVKRSLVAGGGGLLRLPRLLSRAVAFELALTGDSILAERAYELGMVNRLTEPGGALDGALKLAAAITPNASLAFSGYKSILNESQDWPVAEFFERVAELADPIIDAEDANEAAIAFTHRRPPE
jgi:enoyl-CoA hydratase